MKRLVILVLIAAFVLPMFGCSGDADPQAAADLHKKQLAGETAQDRANHD